MVRILAPCRYLDDRPCMQTTVGLTRSLDLPRRWGFGTFLTFGSSLAMLGSGKSAWPAKSRLYRVGVGKDGAGCGDRWVGQSLHSQGARWQLRICRGRHRSVRTLYSHWQSAPAPAQALAQALALAQSLAVALPWSEALELALACCGQALDLAVACKRHNWQKLIQE